MRLVAKRKPEKSAFGSRLRSLREARGLTLEQLGDRLEMHFTAISRIERGLTQPTWPTVLRIAEALGVSTDEFKAASEPSEPEGPTDEPKPNKPQR